MTKQDDEHIVGVETMNDDYDSPWKNAVEHYSRSLWPFIFQRLMMR